MLARAGDPRRRRRASIVAGGMESMTQRALPPARGARRRAARPRQARSTRWSATACGTLQRLPHGHDRRARRREVRDHARGAGRVRRREPPRAPTRPTPPGASTPRSFAGRDPAAEGRADRASRRDEAIRARHDAPRRSPSSSRPSSRGRHGHRGQRLADQRRRRGAGRDERDERAKALGVKPLARITGYATGGGEPEWVMMAPEDVDPKPARRRSGKKPADFDLIEVNEAFSAAALRADARARPRPGAGQRERRRGRARPPDRRLGRARPDDAALRAASSAARSTGIATLCLGGGNAVALAVEALCLSGPAPRFERGRRRRRRHDGQRHRPGVRARTARDVRARRRRRRARSQRGAGGDREEPRRASSKKGNARRGRRARRRSARIAAGDASSQDVARRASS